MDPTVVVDEGDAADTVAAGDEEEDAHADAPLVADAPPDRVALAVEQREDEDVAQPDGAGLDDADPMLVEEPPELTDAPPLDDPVAVEPTDDDNVAVAPPLVDDVPDADCAAVAVASPEGDADVELVAVTDDVADALTDTVASPLAEANAVSVADSVPVADTHAVGRVDTEPKPLGVEHALVEADALDVNTTVDVTDSEAVTEGVAVAPTDLDTVEHEDAEADAPTDPDGVDVDDAETVPPPTVPLTEAESVGDRDGDGGAESDAVATADADSDPVALGAGEEEPVADGVAAAVTGVGCKIDADDDTVAAPDALAALLPTVAEVDGDAADRVNTDDDDADAPALRVIVPDALIDRETELHADADAVRRTVAEPEAFAVAAPDDDDVAPADRDMLPHAVAVAIPVVDPLAVAANVPRAVADTHPDGVGDAVANAVALSDDAADPDAVDVGDEDTLLVAATTDPDTVGDGVTVSETQVERDASPVAEPVVLALAVVVPQSVAVDDGVELVERAAVTLRAAV